MQPTFRPRRTAALTALVASAVIALVALAAVPAGAGSSADAASQALVDQGTLVASDLPAGWTAEPRDTTGEDEGLKVAKKIPACKGYVAFEESNDGTTGAKSPDFTNGTDQIHNAVYAYVDSAAAEKVFASIEAKKTVAKCLTQMLDTRLEQALGSDKSVKRTRALVKPVEESLSTAEADTVGFGGGYEVTMKDGTKQQRLVVLVASRLGRAISTYSLDADVSSSDAGTALQTALGSSLTRLQSAQ